MAIASIQKAKGTFEVVTYLYRHGNAMKTELIERVHACQTSVYRAIDILKSLDLISEEEDTSFPKKKIYSLTEKGRIFAEAPFYRWDQILGGWTYPLKKNDDKKLS